MKTLADVSGARSNVPIYIYKVYLLYPLNEKFNIGEE